MDKKRETLMKKIQMYQFAAHECVLYLDCHPNNKKAMEKYKDFVKKMKESVSEYESMYGPLNAYSAGEQGNGGWNWISGKWPWQNEED